MTTTINLKEWAKHIYSFVKGAGDPQKIEVEIGDYFVEVNYTAEVRTENGRYSGPYCWVERERFDVVGVWDEDGEEQHDIMKQLQAII